TQIQGPIEILFEGIQRFYPWKDIMKGPVVGSAIETKLQVIELSLLPPNAKGIMPSGVQRFPFEFPIPSSLPMSVEIPDRLEIFYQLSATLRRSTSQHEEFQSIDSFNPVNWIEWARRTTFKKKYVACSPIRIVRAMESVFSDTLPTTNTIRQNNDTETSSTAAEDNSDNISSNHHPSTSSTAQQPPLPWNRRNLDAYSGSFDEQHDQLAFSLAGRASGNLHHSTHALADVQGIRYKIGIDRTAVAIGTSIGVEIMIEPTMADAVVKSVLLKITESRNYSMKVPAGHTWKTTSPETKQISEGVKMVMKWAYGHPMGEEETMVYKNKGKKKASDLKKSSEKYVYHRTENSQGLFYFDPPEPGHSKSFLNSVDEKKKLIIENVQQETELGEPSFSSSELANPELINLKQLNQPVKLGEYFGGRFVLPVPDCSNMLNPSMSYESIKITHWTQLIVTVECNGQEFDLCLNTPSRILCCRLVAADDECQTILPPPPSYVPGDSRSYRENNWSTSTFWEQREPITSVSGWGSHVPCPCEYKRLKASILSNNNILNISLPNSGRNNSSKSNKSSISNDRLSASYSPSHLPEWGPPPCYSENQ
ncbi:hypothetical protein CU098_010768, partial [Rhizopus stolonifer]